MRISLEMAFFKGLNWRCHTKNKDSVSCQSAEDRNGGKEMLVSAKEMLQKAKQGHYAVGQFNINNLEWTKAILQTAQELNSPVILGVSEGAGKYM